MTHDLAGDTLSDTYLRAMFGVDRKVAVVTGGTGVLGGAMARGLARAGARVVVLGRRTTLATEVAGEIESTGGKAMPVGADVMQAGQLEEARDRILQRWGTIDILVNAAGGNVPEAIVTPERSLFDLSPAALREVMDLNYLGTVLPSQVFGAPMVQRGEGSIVNVSSMAVARALTRIVGYSAGKAALENFTRWLAVHLARSHGEGIRVNGIAPGFFLGEQNRALLVQADGTPTERGQVVLDHTPMGRFGEPDDLVSTLLWLCSPGARFVTGVVIPVDGGFSAYAGV